MCFSTVEHLFNEEEVQRKREIQARAFERNGFVMYRSGVRREMESESNPLIDPEDLIWNCSLLCIYAGLQSDKLYVIEIVVDTINQL